MTIYNYSYLWIFYVYLWVLILTSSCGSGPSSWPVSSWAGTWNTRMSNMWDNCNSYRIFLMFGPRNRECIWSPTYLRIIVLLFPCSAWSRGRVVRVTGYRSIGSGLDSRNYQIFWEVVGLEQGSLRLLSTTEELLGINKSSSRIEIREYSHGDPLHWPCNTLYPQKLALTSPISGGRSVGIVCSRTKATEFSFFMLSLLIYFKDGDCSFLWILVKIWHITYITSQKRVIFTGEPQILHSYLV
jgi:hypothetical protein